MLLLIVVILSKYLKTIKALLLAFTCWDGKVSMYTAPNLVCSIDRNFIHQELHFYFNPTPYRKGGGDYK